VPSLKVLAICLASMMHGEARGEGDVGMLAVGKVAVERTHLSGRDACQVVGAPGQFAGYDPGYLPTRHEVALAMRALAGEGPQLYGADHFAERSVRPHWRAERVATIGNHTFYRTRR